MSLLTNVVCRPRVVSSFLFNKSHMIAIVSHGKSAKLVKSTPQ